MRVPTPADEVGHGDALGRDGALRQQPEDPGDLFRGPLVQGLPVEDDPSRPRREQTGEGAQQRGLAAAVRADDRRDASGRQDEVEAVDDGPIRVAEGEVLGGEGAIGGHRRPPHGVAGEACRRMPVAVGEITGSLRSGWS